MPSAYLLRGSLPEAMFGDGPGLWRTQIQLVQVEEALKNPKGVLAVRPIRHRIEPRVEAYILVAFLGYVMLASQRMKLQRVAPGLAPRTVLEKLAAIWMVNVCIPTTDGR